MTICYTKVVILRFMEVSKTTRDTAAKSAGQPRASKNKTLVAVLVVVLIGLGLTLYGYIDAKREIAFLATPDGQVEASRRLVADTLEAVGKLIVLPEGEDTPFVFTIQNAEELASQEPFYNKAKDGDRLIVFSDRAIIYNPDNDILVNVGPVTFQSAEEAQDLPPPPPPPPSMDEGGDESEQ